MSIRRSWTRFFSGTLTHGWHISRKARGMGLLTLCCMILTRFWLIRRVTDGRTDGRTGNSIQCAEHIIRCRALKSTSYDDSTTAPTGFYDTASELVTVLASIVKRRGIWWAWRCAWTIKWTNAVHIPLGEVSFQQVTDGAQRTVLLHISGTIQWQHISEGFYVNVIRTNRPLLDVACIVSKKPSCR